MENVLKRISLAVRSDKFFVAVLLIFIIQALWIAASAAYPQPFDENTHLGIIKIYSHYWHPFIGQLPDASQYGAVASNPSYLYHYLLSFPYRIFAHFISEPATQIFALRLFNIAFFAGGLVLFRKVLQRTRAGNGLINVTLMFFVLIPVVPLLAGQLNYDNLLMLFAGALLLLTLQFTDKLRQKYLDIPLLLVLLSVGLLGCLVQYEFLPLLAAVIIWLAYELFRYAKDSPKKINIGYAGILIPLVIFAGSLGLFMQRYGVNMVRYGTPLPKCHQILSIKQCSLYSTWRRSYAATSHPLPANHNPMLYTKSWLARMFITSFYTRSGGNPGAKYVNAGPYPVISATAIIVFTLGGGLFLWRVRTILPQHRALIFLLFVSILYCAVLWLHLYRGFLHTGQKFALNGRYLFPVILPMMLAAGLGFDRWLKNRQSLKPLLSLVVFLLFLQGGGILTFINASNRYWYWPDNGFSLRINQAAQRVTKPFILTHL
jgi:hypothetical protein